MTSLLRLMLRRHRARILGWVLPLVTLVAIAPAMYGSTYADARQRAVIVEQLRASAGTKLVYGELPLPGTAGQMTVWEMGTYVAVLGCISTMLLALALTRGDEETGGTELLLTHGLSRSTVLGAAMLVVLGQALLLGAGSALVVAAQVGHVREISTSGALCLGLALLLATGFFGALGLLLGEVFPSAGQVRGLLFSALGLAFVVKGLGEANGWGWTRWCSPVAWLQLLSPFTRDRFWPAMLLGPVVLAVAGLAFWANRRREFAAGLVSSREHSGARARVRTVVAFSGLLARRSQAGWMLGVLATSGFFASMAQTMTSAARHDAHTGDLMSQMTGGMGPEAGYFSYMGTLVALLAGCSAVARVLWVRGQERSGLLDPVVVTGQRRESPLRAAVLWAVAGGWLMLLVACGLAVGCATLQLDDPQAWHYAARSLLGQLPAVLLCAGLASLAVGVLPRASALGWLPVAFSGGVTLLGPTMKAPHWLLQCSLFSHSPVTGWDPLAAAVVSVLGLLACLAGSAAFRRRDLVV